MFSVTPIRTGVNYFVTDAVTLVRNELKLFLGRGCGFLVAQGGNFFIDADTCESANWSLFGAERWSLSEVSFY